MVLVCQDGRERRQLGGPAQRQRSGALTIEPNGSETIDGAANNNEMDAANDSITIVCDGSAWYIVAKKIS